jgi:choline monooxygenase
VAPLQPFAIDPDIRRAAGPPGEFYRDPAWYEATRARVFGRTWHLVADAAAVAVPGTAVPATLLEGALDEPIVLARDAAGVLRAFANVCTHRGARVVEEPGRAEHLRCRYHGRRYRLDGHCLSMPEFDGVEGFPSPADDLRPVAVAEWGPFVFAALDPIAPFAELITPVAARTAWLPLADFRAEPEGARDYDVRASWALWCDNYLEGFHVPYVHPTLARALDYSAYSSETFRWTSLQIGIAAGDADRFEPPPGHPDAGRAVAGWYFALFPTTMLNFYPWGISVNQVLPLAPDRVRVRYRSWVWRSERREQGAGAGLHAVELEDDAIVESAQRGVTSRAFGRARYSPAREQCVHHFHRLLAELLC